MLIQYLTHIRAQYMLAISLCLCYDDKHLMLVQGFQNNQFFFLDVPHGFHDLSSLTRD